MLFTHWSLSTLNHCLSFTIYTSTGPFHAAHTIVSAPFKKRRLCLAICCLRRLLPWWDLQVRPRSSTIGPPFAVRACSTFTRLCLGQAYGPGQ